MLQKITTYVTCILFISNFYITSVFASTPDQLDFENFELFIQSTSESYSNEGLNKIEIDFVEDLDELKEEVDDKLNQSIGNDIFNQDDLLNNYKFLNFKYPKYIYPIFKRTNELLIGDDRYSEALEKKLREISHNVLIELAKSSKEINTSSLEYAGFAAGGLIVALAGSGSSSCSLPKVSLTISSTSINEDSGSTITITATADKTHTSDITVAIETSGTATEGTDYSSVSDITIVAGSLTGEVTLTPTNDSIYDSSSAEIATFTGGSLVNACSYLEDSRSVSLTIVDDEEAPTAQLAASSTSATEDGDDITLTATLSHGTYEDVLVTVTGSGTATDDTDYVMGNITIAAGSTTGTTTFNPTSDDLYDAASSETATIDITNVSGGGASENSTPQQVSITLADNDSAPTAILSTSSTSATEDGSSLTLTGTLSIATYEDVTITLTGTGSATDDTDYVMGNITVSAGNTTGTTTFNPSSDELYDAASSETATIDITNVSGGGATENSTPQQIEITLADSDSAPTVSFEASSSSIGEAGADVTLTATLSIATYEDVSVSITPSGTATEGTDYATISDITISAGSTTATTAFNPTDDTGCYEDTETAIIAVSAVSGGGSSGSPSTTISITENESAPVVTLATSSTSATEDGSDLTLTSELSICTYEAVAVTLTGTGTATDDTDYVMGNIEVAAGNTSATTTFNPTSDDLYDAASAETATIDITNVSGGGASEHSTAQQVSITLTDNDSAPTVTLTASSSTLDENSNDSITITSTLSIATYEDVLIGITPSGTATEGSDYQTISDITVSAGTTTGTTSFSTSDDCILEGDTDETANVAISSVAGGGASESGSQSVALAIDDDEGNPVVTLTSSASSITEGDGSITLTASIGLCEYTEDITVGLDGTGGTATEGTDFNTVADITISTGNTTGTATLTPIADSLYDASSSETAVIAISSVSGGTASESGTQSETITIIDSDSAPTVTIDTNASSVAENSSDNITVTGTLSVKTYQDVTITLGTSGTATDDTDYAIDDTITIIANSLSGTATFNPTDDAGTHEADETAVISITSVSGGSATESGTQEKTLTIVENESPPTVTLTTASNNATEDGSDVQLTATLSISTYEDVTVSLGTSGTATNDTDYALSDTITVSSGNTTGTGTFNPTPDTLYDAASSETAIIAIATVSGGEATEDGTQSQTITLADSDDAPTVILASSASSVAEDGSDLTLTATASIATYEDITVTIDGTGGTATEGTDFATVSDITISAGGTTGTTAFNPTDDTLYDVGSETGVIAISGVDGGGASEDGSQSVTNTITDNESAPTWAFSTSSSSVTESGSDVTITATLTHGIDADLTIGLSASATPSPHDGTATDDTDFAIPANIVISAGDLTGTALFNPTPDDHYDYTSNETASVYCSGVDVSGVACNASGTHLASITIVDEESAPTVTLSTSATSATEDGSDLTLTGTLSVATFADVTITLEGSGTATDDTDYVMGNITVSAGSTSGTSTFNPTPDDLYDAASSETATIDITNVSGGGASENSTPQQVSITLADNDSAPTVTLATSSTSATEDGSDLTLTGNLSIATYEDVTITLEGSGTATDDTDYVMGNITVSAGSTSGTTAFNPTPDDLYDATSSETATIDVTNVSGGSATESSTPQQISITLADNDSSPTVTLASSASSVSEDGSNLTITATASVASYADISVVIDGTGGSATEGTDFASVSDITISAGYDTGTATFNPTDDGYFDSATNETAVIAISSVSGGSASAGGSNQSASITLVSAESAPTITLASSGSSISETGSNLTLTATSSVVTYEDITVSIDGTGGTATEGTDFSTVSDITISQGSTYSTATFTITDDDIYDALSSETAVIAISSVSGGSASESGSQSASITITDDESAPTATLTTSSTSATEDQASNITLTGTLTGKTFEDVTITLSGTGTATDDTDYAMGNITVSAGSTSGTSTFNPTPDALYDAASAETATIDITNVSGGGASENSTPQQVSITLTDNDSAPTVTLTSSADTVYDSAGNLTITATLSIATYEDVSVGISTTGTATENSDYATVSDITVSAGSTSGTTSFNPIADSTYEGTETATLAISTVDGGGASENSTPQTVSISITEYGLNLETQFAEVANRSSVYTAYDEYTYINAPTSSYIHPYTSMNIHRAWAFQSGSQYLDGTGIYGSVVDVACDYQHSEFSAKRSEGIVYHYGSTQGGNDSASSNHCNMVMSMMAGDYNGTTNDDADVIGVAYGAGIHFTDLSYNDQTYYLDYARLGMTHSYSNYSPVVVNNSWSPKDTNAGSPYTTSEATAHVNANAGSYTKDQVLGTYFSYYIGDENNLIVKTAKTNAWTNYISYLDTFQSNGVIVFTTSNKDGETDSSVMCGLPTFYSNLSEAFLCVGYVDIAGTSISSSTVSSNLGNDCGLSAAWCLVADAKSIRGAAHFTDNSYYYTETSGSSFAAPMVSGMVILLNQAFPNHTPEQITDRLLASANNSFFTQSAAVTFANGIQHGYNSEYGHGIPDMLAALSPITSSSYNDLAFFVGGYTSQQSSSSNSNGDMSHSLGSTEFIASSSFGDSYINGLENNFTYAYDALYGGFRIDLNRLISHRVSNNNLLLNIANDLQRLSLPINIDKEKNFNYSFSNVFGKVGNKEVGQLGFSLESTSAPIRHFNQINNGSSFYLASFENPFTDNSKIGFGINAQYQFDDTAVLIGYHNNEIRLSNNLNDIDQVETFAISFTQQNDYFDNITILTGLMIEEDTLLDSKGSGALGFHGTNPHSLFAGVNFEKVISNDLSVKFVSTIGHSTLDTPVHSLIGEVSPITSSSFNLILNKYGVMHDDDRLSVSIGQPNRVETGTMTFRIPELADSEGNLTYANREIDLNPSGRQIDIGIDYVTKLDNDLIFGFKNTLSKDYNHIKSNNVDLATTLTVRYTF